MQRLRHSLARRGTIDHTWYLLALTFVLATWPAWAQGQLEAIKGSWAGTVTESSVPAAPVGAPLSITVTPNGDDLQLSWISPDGKSTEVKLAPSSRPGIWRAVKGGFFSMFGDSETVNPLAGDELVWARLQQDTLFLYRMNINRDGTFVIDRYGCRPVDGKVEVELSRQASDAEALSARAVLERKG
ncbi:MAG: hypothetical protein U1E45_00355 [Geminicoccaceae bacterium]